MQGFEELNETVLNKFLMFYSRVASQTRTKRFRNVYLDYDVSKAPPTGNRTFAHIQKAGTNVNREIFHRGLKISMICGMHR